MLNRAVVMVVAMVAACASAPDETPAARVVTPQCVTIQRGHGTVIDSYVKPNALNKNFGDKPTLRVSSSDESLLRFDLSAIPSSCFAFDNCRNASSTVRGSGPKSAAG